MGTQDGPLGRDVPQDVFRLLLVSPKKAPEGAFLSATAEEDDYFASHVSEG
jgi:hypothetical protein